MPQRSTRRPTASQRSVERRVEYDYLIVATGLTLDWDAVEGFDLSQTGPDTGHHRRNYAGPEEAAKTWAALDKFTDQGGRWPVWPPCDRNEMWPARP